MLGNLTPTERRVIAKALRERLAELETGDLYRRDRGLKSGPQTLADMATLKNLLAQLG